MGRAEPENTLWRKAPGKGQPGVRHEPSGNMLEGELQKSKIYS